MFFFMVLFFLLAIGYFLDINIVICEITFFYRFRVGICIIIVRGRFWVLGFRSSVEMVC